jgi:DNA invertase Pin-like site-specific DNA recombinase
VKAYSYVRFSSSEQMSGDSVRRQTALAEAYAEEFGLVLDDELTYRDLGVSSFHSQNATSGRLGAFLAAACSGAVPAGSVLLVENLDRLSRDNALVAQNLLTQLVMAGVSIVTLSDRREYSIAELKRDPMGLLFALINFIRANEESELKSSRMRASWTAKRTLIVSEPLTAKCPAWLRLDPVTRKFVLNAPRVRTVRNIYSLAAAGMSLVAIAIRLAKAKRPLWEHQTAWTPEGIGRLLKHVAVVGTFIPHRNVWREGKAIRVACAPVPNYFPAIVAPELFHKAQARRHAGRGERGQHTNIVNLLARCSGCGAFMVLTRYGAEASQVLACSTAKAGLGCTYREVAYAPIEAALRARLASVMLEIDISSPRDGRTHKLMKAQNAVDRARRRLSGAHANQLAWASSMEEGGDEANDKEAFLLQQAVYNAEDALLEAVESCQPKLTKAVQAKVAHALECLASPNGSTSDTTALNAALRALFVRAIVNAPERRIGLWSKNGNAVWIDMG